jgi:glycosyltransferase involved in cell wall biosynthesis
MNQTPVISIITVVLNAAGELEKTISSVLSQDYPRIEFIVIDGGSTDGTVEVIRAHAGQVAYWVSEPDKGIYHAMNKGVEKATGTWLNFMNAGDIFFSDHTVSGLFRMDHGDARVLFGDSVARYPGFRAQRKAMPLENLRRGMICCHQAMFFRSDLLKDNAFNTELIYSADYDLILRLSRAGTIFRYVPETIAVFDTRGISNLKMAGSARSNLEILKADGMLTAKEIRFHRRFICRSKLTELIYRTLPPWVINSFLKWLYRDQIIHEQGPHE